MTYNSESNKLIKERFHSVMDKICFNFVRFFVFFIVVFVFVSLLYDRNPVDNIRVFFSFEKTIPDTFKVVFGSSLLFIIFIIVVSAEAVVREQNFFRSSIFIRLLVFAMNVLPIALFQYNIFPRFGFRIIYFGVVLIFFQIILDMLVKPLISQISGTNRLVVFFGKIIPEILAIFLSILTVNILGIDKTAEMRNLEMSNPYELITYFLYIVMFNSVTFFSVEYCMSIFKEEYKKNYSKFYFVFNHNSFMRIFHVLKGALPQVLEKVRKNISWLIMFIIAVDSIFENLSGIGSNLADGYSIGSDINASLIIIDNIMYLLIIMYLINIIIDIAVIFLTRGKEDEKPITDETGNTFEVLPQKKKNISVKLSISLFLVIYTGLFIFNLKEYAFAGYYDFHENKNRTVGAYLDFKNIKADRYPEDVYLSYADTPLCEQIEGTAYYSLIQITFQDKEDNVFDLIPFYDKGDVNYYYIRDNKNTQGKFDLSLTDRVLSINRITKYKNIAFSGEMISFRLGAGTSRTIYGAKPSYLIIPFYIFYFFTIVLIAVIFTCMAYNFIIKYHIFGKSRFNCLFDITKKTVKEILFFLNSLTLIVLFQLMNIFLQRNIDISWKSNDFLFSFLSYVIIQFVIILMFSSTYAGEISIHVKKYIFSDEFKYYGLIGMDPKSRRYIYDKKYGRFLLLKLIFQNILFVLNINWFLSYVFNVWPAFKDSIGITYAISFENIFTKIIYLESVSTNPGNYMILAALNVVLFVGYYYCQKRMDSE
jgi:hypothetical protein